ncbi:MAG: cell division protein FtsA [Candidatus Saccharimonadales bacterium]
MQENSRYAVGLDVGTTKVRCVVGHVEGAQASPTIIGVGECANSGMRKGTVVNLVNTASAIDSALEAAERMSGFQIQNATISVNGSHIIGMSSKGVIAVGANGHEITDEDLRRVEEAATVVQLPANREILEVTPRSYQLDGQDNIKDPIGMTGVRLEVDAHVITALGPHLKNLRKACEMTETIPHATILAGLAAARAVVSDQQTENGVVLIDLGGTTTNIAVFEEGDLQHVAVLPVGSVNITNDLAIGLKTDLDIAESVKLDHASAMPSQRTDKKTTASVKVGDKTHTFDLEDIDMIVDARLEEIFELINKELKSIGRAAKLPGGAVLTGGGAQLKGLADYARNALQISARIGEAPEFAGVSENVHSPDWSTALGLMLIDLEGGAVGVHTVDRSTKSSKNSFDIGKVTGKITEVFGKFRS